MKFQVNGIELARGVDNGSPLCRESVELAMPSAQPGPWKVPLPSAMDSSFLSASRTSSIAPVQNTTLLEAYRTPGLYFLGGGKARD